MKSGQQETRISRVRPVPHVRVEKMNGKPFQIAYARINDTVGAVGTYEGKDHIFIDDRLVGMARLETIVHEALHACLDEMPEETVERIGCDVARLAYRMFLAESDEEIMSRVKAEGETAIGCRDQKRIHKRMMKAKGKAAIAAIEAVSSGDAKGETK